jgi:hypothetical protein
MQPPVNIPPPHMFNFTLLVELSLGTLLTLKVKKVSYLLSGYMETSSIHNRTTVDFGHEC